MEEGDQSQELFHRMRLPRERPKENRTRKEDYFLCCWLGKDSVETGSGKTHTMLGDIEGGTRRHSILDLLEPSSNNLQIREDSKKGVYVENLKEVEVTSARDVIQQLIQGYAAKGYCH
ncbi:hypothetical protein K1719_002560 [Acacia pycnantha]|nr:hypothetical protein K1719_002560 [Acacia pycnantha]